VIKKLKRRNTMNKSKSPTIIVDFDRLKTPDMTSESILPSTVEKDAP